MRRFTSTMIAVLLVGLASANGETITFEDGTSNPFVLDGNAAIGTPGDASTNSLVMTADEGTGSAIWTTGVTTDTVDLTARIRPDLYNNGAAEIYLYDGGARVTAVGFSCLYNGSSTAFKLLMHVDGPGYNDYTDVELTDWIDWGDGTKWPDAWYDVSIQVASGEIDLSLTGPGVTGGNYNYTYAPEINNVVVQLWARPYGRDVLVDNVTFSYPAPVLPATLTVQSDRGDPVPAVGEHAYYVGNTVTCQVDSITQSLTNYSAASWTLSGASTDSGTDNPAEITLEGDTVITWNWQTNYWLDVSVSGSGSADGVDGFHAKDSEQILTATPDAGWLFMGWSGDASGTNDTAVTMDAPKSVTATFSDDADGDGLTNTEEAGIGSNPWKTDTDNDGFDDKTEVDYGLSPTNDSSGLITYIQDHDSTFGLYPSNAVLDVAVGQMLLQTAGTNAVLQLQLEESDDLVTWTNAGDAVEWSWPVDGDKKFFRVRSY